MRKHTIKALHFILWPFRLAYKGVSWTLLKIVGHDFAEKHTTQHKDTHESYVPFKIIEDIEGEFNKFESFIIKNPSTIGIILGARGTGKTAFGLKLFENIHSKSMKHFYAMGFNAAELPSWIRPAEVLSDISNNSYVLIDEGGILFSSRKSLSSGNKLLSELLLVARHKDMSVLFISQNSSNLEINAIRQADYLVMKPSSLLQKDFERKKIKEIYSEITPKLRKHSRIKGLTYIYSDKYRGFVSNPLPTFWTDNISKNFRRK